MSEVHNFGGFFAGNTVTLSGRHWRTAGAALETLTIDEAALTNVGERHHLVAGMLLELELAGERVEHATLLGAASHSDLRRALGPAVPAGLLAGPLVLSYHCGQCRLWIAGGPWGEGGTMGCRLCGKELLCRGG